VLTPPPAASQLGTGDRGAFSLHGRLAINPEFGSFLDKSAVGLPGNGKHPLHEAMLAGARGRRSGA
jgi:hypothetical protein